MTFGIFKLESEQLFGQIAERIKYKNAAGYTDLNKDLEGWLGPIFNIYFEAEFVTEKSINAPAIDLADRKKAIAIQITSTSSNNKIKKTLIQVYKNNYHREFNNIYLLFLKLDSSDVTFNLQSFRSSPDFKKLAKENEWNDEIFNPSTHILDFRKIIDKLGSHEYCNLWDDIISKLKKITGYVESEHNELKNYLAKGDSINEILNPNDVTQSLKIIKDYFGPFIKLPDYIFLKLQLYGNQIGSSLIDGCLDTSNTQLIDKVKTDIDKNIVSPIIEFLIQNGVSYIYDISKKDITNLKIANANINDNCKICAYRKLEVIDIPKINEESIEENLLLLIENLYLLVEYGKYEDSILLFQKLLNFTKKEEKYGLTHFHLAYNFKRFYENYLPSSFIEKKKVLFKNLTNYINGDLWVISFERIKNKETRLIAEHCINLLHIENQLKTLRLIKTVDEIIDIDIKGGNSSSMVKKLENEIYHYIWDIFSNTAHNKILFDTQYTNASMVLFKSFEILLKLSSLKNQRSYTVKYLNIQYLEILIIQLNYSDLGKLLQNFKNKAEILQNKESLSSINNTCIQYLKTLSKTKVKKLVYIKEMKLLLRD
ncbi:MAG: SMEK domain-containing protein [Saprospiraceae bacterium]